MTEPKRRLAFGKDRDTAQGGALASLRGAAGKAAGNAVGGAGGKRGSSVEWTAGALSVIWLAVAALFWLFLPAPEVAASPSSVVVGIVAFVLPVALIWVAAIAARNISRLRSEAQLLRAEIASLRAGRPSGPASAAPAMPDLERRLDDVARVAREAQTALAAFAGQRGAAPSRMQSTAKATTPSAVRDGALSGAALSDAALSDPVGEELGAAAETAEEMTMEDLVRALNFPESAQDHEGIRALRMALSDAAMARLIRSAQDVLNLLAQDGIYMEDFEPELGYPDLWRRFAAGERGDEVATLGAMEDETALAVAAERMRQDTIFHDAAHHFLRQFDRAFSGFLAGDASDPEVSALTQTRTARAFLLLGRAAGTFG